MSFKNYTLSWDVIMRTIIPLFLILFFSCKVTEQNLAGTYRLKGRSKTKLVLHEDSTFEFVKNFSKPGPVFFPDSTELNFRTAGQWQKDNNGRIILNSISQKETPTQAPVDFVLNNTDITSFSFWDQDGDAIAIRLIVFPNNRTKLHQRNVISFFAEDFSANDTLEFHFYGYPPYRWICSANDKSTNNRHSITLFEEYRPAYFSSLILMTDRKKLLPTDKSFSLYKRR